MAAFTALETAAIIMYLIIDIFMLLTCWILYGSVIHVIMYLICAPEIILFVILR